MKRFIYLAIAMMLFVGCATQKKAVEAQGAEYTAEEVELVGYEVSYCVMDEGYREEVLEGDPRTQF